MPGDVVLPLSEHPAIIAERVIQPLPPGRKRLDKKDTGTQAMMIAQYFHANPPADAYTIAAALGLNWESVRRVLAENPNLFRHVGEIQVRKVKRAIWGRLDDALIVVAPSPTVPRRMGRPASDDLQRVVAYLREHGPATSQEIAEATGLRRRQVKGALARGGKMFQANISGRNSKRPGGKFFLWGLME